MKQDVVQQIGGADQVLAATPAHHELPSFAHCAILLDIDGTLLDLAPTPHEVVVPPGLDQVLIALQQRAGGALALVSGRSLADIDRIFAPVRFAAIGGHGAEMRICADTDAIAAQAPPINDQLKLRLAAIAQLDPRILLEDKGYALALHYRQAPHAERAIYEAVSVIRADLPSVPFDVLPGKAVCEIKPAGVTKASGVRELLRHPPFRGRRPMFIGDDVTDETVFAIMPDLRGLAYSVGRHATGVDGVFAAPRDVRRWLAQWLAQS
ncbi:trehalose-phosphatase [Rhodopseudomonas pseudopalustris]|uniref:trehalose-phosphatase n=1 Tax=Rhodopseudomonas pseudopalustris TaxID=1513892 RepID=UPI003F9AA59C